MSTIIEEIRKKTGDTRSPEAITFELGQRIEQENRPDIFETHPDFRDEYYAIKRELRDGPLTTLGTGLKVGVLDRLPELAFNLGEMAATGVDLAQPGRMGVATPGGNAITSWFSEQSRREQEEAAARTDPMGVSNFEAVQNPADLLNFGARVTGENLPQLGASFIPGAIAGRLAQAARLAKGAAAADAALSGIKAAQAAAYVSSAVQNTADIYGNLDAETRQSAKGVAAAGVGGALAGALDALGELPLMSRLFPALEKQFVPAVVLSVLRRGGVTGSLTTATLQAGTEGITEALQEGIAIASEEYAQGREYPVDYIRSRILNAGAGGAILGGGIGGVAGVVPGAGPAESLRPELAEPIKPSPAAPVPASAPAQPGLSESFVPRQPAYNAMAADNFSDIETPPATGRLSRLGNVLESELDTVIAADEAAQVARKIIDQPANEPPTELGALAAPSAGQPGDEISSPQTPLSSVVPTAAPLELGAITEARAQARADAIAASYNTDVGDLDALYAARAAGVGRAMMGAGPAVTDGEAAAIGRSMVEGGAIVSQQKVEQVRQQVEARHAIQESSPANLPQAQPPRGVQKVAKGVRPAEGAAQARAQEVTPLIPSVKYVATDKPLPVKNAPLNALLFTQDDGDSDHRIAAAAGSSVVKSSEKAVRRSVLILDRSNGNIYNRLVWAQDAASTRPGQGIRIDDAQRKLYAGEPGYKKGGRGIDFQGGDESAPWSALRDQQFNGQPRFEVLGYLHWDKPQTTASFNFATIDDLQNNPAMNRVLRRNFQPEPNKAAAVEAAKKLQRGTAEGRLRVSSDVGTSVKLAPGVMSLSEPTAEGGATRGDAISDEHVEDARVTLNRNDIKTAIENLQALAADPTKKAELKSAVDALAAELVKARGSPENLIPSVATHITGLLGTSRLASILSQMTVRTGESYVSSIPQADAKFYAMLGALQSSGIDVLVAQPKLIEAITGEAKARGVTLTDRDGKALIALAANYQLGTITDDDILSLYHEGAHPFVNDLPQWQQQAYQFAVSQLPWQKQNWLSSGLGRDARLIANTPVGELSAEQRLIFDRMTPEEVNVLRGTDPSVLAVERAVEHLAVFGIQDAQARDVMSQIIRFVKGVMMRIGIELQRMLKGDTNVRPDLVRAYVENKWLQFINRDFAASSSALAVGLKEWIGAPKTVTERLMVYGNINGEDQNFYYDPRTGASEPISPGTGTAQAAIDFIDRIIRDKNLGTAISSLTTRSGIPMAILDTMSNGIPFEELSAEQQVKLIADAQRQIESVQLAKNKDGQLVAPNGQPSKLNELQWRIARTPFFVRWFGDWINDPAKASKVVDPETLEPRVVYHGTSATFEEFKHGLDLGFHFGTTQEANEILNNNRVQWVQPQHGEQMIPAFLNIRNPAPVVDGIWSGMTTFGMDALMKMENSGIITRKQHDLIMATESRTDHEAVLKQVLRDNGYDGAVYLNVVEGDGKWAAMRAMQPETFIAFNAEQVKTAYNRTFTPSKQMQLTVRAAESLNPTVEANTQFAAINHVASVVSAIVNDPAVRDTLPARYLKDGQNSVEQLVFGIGKTNLTSARLAALAADLSQQLDVSTNRPFAFNPATKINELPVTTDGSSAQQKAMRDSLLQLQAMETAAIRKISRMRERKAEIEAVRSEKKREVTVAEQNELDRLNQDIPAFDRMLALKDVGLHDQILRMQGKLRVGLLFDVVGGVEYLVPPTITAGEDAVLSSKAKVPANLNFETPARQEFSRNLGRMQAWLDNADNRKSGWLYETVSTQFRKLSEVNLRPTYDALSARFKKTAFDSLPNMLRGIGTPQAKHLAAMFYKLEAPIQRHAADLETIGGKWSSLYDATKRAVKFNGLDDDYRTRYFNRLMQLMAATPDGTPDPYNKVIDVFNRIRPTAYQIGTAARPAFRDLLRATVESEKHLAKIFSDLGLRVQDEGLGTDDLGRVRQRGLVREGLVTGRLSVSSSLDSIWEEMKPIWTSTSDAPSLLADAEALWRTDRKTFDALADVFFSPQVKKDFVEPLVFSNKQFFSSTQGAELGIKTMASQANVRSAWNTSIEANPGGDINIFIAELNRLEGGTANTEAAMAGQVMRSLRGMFAKVNQVSNERAQAKVNGIPTLPREMMNARTAEDFPSEWVDYALYDQGSNKVALHSMALNNAFGRDGLTSAEFAKNMTAVSTELDAIRRQYTRLRKESGLDAKATRAVMGDDRYRIALDWQDHQYLLNNINEKMRYLVNPISTQLGDLRLADELVGLSALGTMQNVRSALVNTTDTFGALYRQKFSTAGLKAVKDAISYTAADSASALMEMFGTHLHFMADFARRNRDLGAKDPDNFITWRQRMTDYGTGNALAPGDDTQSWSTKTQNTGILLARRAKSLINANPAEMVGELANRAMKTNFIPSVPGDQALAPKLRLMGIFKSSAMWLANGAVYGQYNAYKDLVMRGVEFINKSNNPAEYARRLADGEMALDPRSLGYTRKWMVLNDRAAWDYMTDAIETKMNQGSLERMVATAWMRTQADPKAPIITDEQFARIRGLALSDVQLNAMTTNLPADWRANPMMRSLGVFLSWPYMAMLRFPALFQDAKGRYTLEAAADGMLTMILPIIPLTMAASIGVDWYDEYALGKKQNLRDVGLDSLVPGLAPFAYPMATLERMARYGTGGFASEIINATLNYDDTRGGLSADSRVFLLSQLQNFRYTVGNLWQTEHADYKSVVRPLMQFIGANGVLQYAQLANHTLGLNNQESAINERISIGNYLRAIGRDLDLQVLPSKQSGQGIPTKTTPFLGQMELAVYQDDMGAFRDAFAEAVRAYREEHPDAIDPAKDVIRSFQSRHPLRRVFRVAPSEGQYRQILDNLSEPGRDAVDSGVRLFNKYLLKLGVKPFSGKDEPSAYERAQKKAVTGGASLIEAQMRAAQAAYSESFID